MKFFLKHVFRWIIITYVPYYIWHYIREYLEKIFPWTPHVELYERIAGNLFALILTGALVYYFYLKNWIIQYRNWRANR